jgi:hypothetical protein
MNCDEKQLITIINDKKINTQTIEYVLIEFLKKNPKFNKYILKYFAVKYPSSLSSMMINLLVNHNEKFNLEKPVSKIITKFNLLNNNLSKNELLENNLVKIVLSAHNIKLCEIDIFKNIVCQQCCECGSREYWKKIYYLIIDSFNSIDLTKSTEIYARLYSNLRTLVKNTDVLDDNLYILFKNQIFYQKNWNYILYFIRDCKLYSSKYIDLVKIIYSKTTEIILTTSAKETILYSHMSQKNISLVINNMYVTDLNGINNISLIKEINAKYVISLTKKKFFRISNIFYTQIKIDDNGCFNFINFTIDAAKNVATIIEKDCVVINCFRGLSRSVCFAILVLMVKGYSFEYAYSHIIKCRDPINPNPSFIKQLKLFSR